MRLAAVQNNGASSSRSFTISGNSDLPKTLNIQQTQESFAHVPAHMCYVTAWADECLHVLIGLLCKTVRDVSGRKMNVFLIRVFLLERCQMAY